MSNLNDKSKAKQPKNQNGVPPKKRRKVDLPDEPVEMTHITDVNNDCLEQIFKHLDLSDLLNLADTSKLLNNAVHLAFKSKYGKHAVKLVCVKSKKRRRIDIMDEAIEIFDFPTCLKMLRIFGDSIFKLMTPVNKIPERERNELDLYLCEYCAESIVELEYGKATLGHLTKSFTKVETVRFSHARFRCDPADIQRCFPNLRNLTLDKPYAIQSVTGRFPHFEHLNTYVSFDQRKNFAKCLQLNPQLRSLRISGYDLASKFLWMLSACPQLECLYLHDKKRYGLSIIKSGAAPVIFKTVTKFETDASYLKRLDEANISIAFEQLDELEIGHGHSSYGDLLDVIRFVSNHPSITKFTFKVWTRVNEKETLLRLAKALPSVKKVCLQWSAIPTESAFDLIRECHLLESLAFRLKSLDEYDAFKKKLGTEWRSSINNKNFVTLER